MPNNGTLAEPAYARSPNSRGEWESVAHHLLRTGELCSAFAGEFRCPRAGEVLGLFHDLGKYGILFTQVLKHLCCHVDHAGPGAAALFSSYLGPRKAQKDKAGLLAVVAAAHHSRLDSAITNYLKRILRGEDRLYSPGGDTPSLSGVQALSAARQRMLDETGFSPVPLDLFRWQDSEDPDLSYMLLARMLLSALADADYSSSAEHFEPNYLSAHTGPVLDPADALKRVRALREEKHRGSRAAPGINAVRDKLFDNCLQAAEAPPGLFTLTAPTGTGKTLALFAFASRHAQKYGKRRIILILPYLTLAEQNTADYRLLVPDLLESHSAAELDEKSRLLAERWAAPCVVTTAVGFFEPLFASRPTDCRRLHQIADSVIVLDEAQSLPPKLLDATLSCVKELCAHYGCTVLFSTATQPSFQYRPGLLWQPTEVVDDPQAMFSATRRVRFDWRTEAATSWETAADELAAQPQACVIVNLRRHARKLYRLLKERCPGEGVFYLSTDLCLAHRRAVLEQVRRRLDEGQPCRLVSTQCIEAGVDVSFPLLYRALAPLESIIQAAGRCNRNGDTPDGRVVVFLPDDDPARLYPDPHYENAANCVKEMLADGPIDCADLAAIDDYYRRLYRWKAPADDPALSRAISEHDFTGVEEVYQLMGKGGVNVIVPYQPEERLFQALRARMDAEGLTPGLMKQARTLVVTSYRRREVEQLCAPIPLHLPHGEIACQTGWYLLGDPDRYQERLGFVLDGEPSCGIY